MRLFKDVGSALDKTMETAYKVASNKTARKVAVESTKISFQAMLIAASAAGQTGVAVYKTIKERGARK